MYPIIPIPNLKLLEESLGTTTHPNILPPTQCQPLEKKNQVQDQLKQNEQSNLRNETKMIDIYTC